MTADLRVPASDDGTQMLARARRLFGAFAALALVVTVLEWLAASNPVWPQRAVAAVAIVGFGIWALALVRRDRTGPLADVTVVALLVIAGWGMGRPGTILVAILAALQLRALYGSRWSMWATSAGIVGAYVVVEALRRGVLEALTLGSLIVVTAGAAVALIVRALGEVLARRDLEVAWDGVLTHAGGELLGAASHEAVTAVRDDARRRIAELTVEGLDADRALEAAQRRLDGEVELAQERVRSHAQYRTLAEHSRDGIYLLELAPERRYRYLNPAGAAMLGIEARELVDEPTTDRHLVHPEDHQVLVDRRRVDGCLRGRTEVRVRAAQGVLRWLSIEEREVPSHDGTRTVLGTLRDVTEDRRREDALRTALEHERIAAEELRAVDAMKSTFLRALSHELRTPLAAVVGAAETLRSRWDELSPTQIGVMTEIAERRARQLGRLLEDLLDVDRLTGGSVTPHRVPTELLALVERVSAQSDAGTHPVTVEGEAVTVAVDATSVERIVENLLRNARTHTPPGTAVRCRVSRTLVGAQVVVEDDGPGIPAGVRADLFDPFVQGPDSGSRSQPGTGIGLALVSKLAELHGGRARLESPPGGGARFVVDLPERSCREDVAGRAPEAPTVAASRDGRTSTATVRPAHR